jgi:hypothetical protein
MADTRGSVIAWSAGVSAAGAAVAVVFADGGSRWHRVVFAVFLVIAIAAFVILLATGMQGFVSWLRLSRARGRPADPASTPAPASPEIRTQENEASGHGRIFGAQGGEMIVHEDGQDQARGRPAPGPAEQPAQHPGQTQRNVATDNGEVFAVQDGDLYVHRLPGEEPKSRGPG